MYGLYQYDLFPRKPQSNKNNYNPVKEVALQVTIDKIKYVFMSHTKNAGQMLTTKTGKQILLNHEKVQIFRNYTNKSKLHSRRN
jgi:hypothetical protein